MHKTKSEFSEILFEDGQFPPELIVEFFYYVSEDKEFLDVCKLNNSMKMYDFLVAKLLSYNNNLKTSND